MSRPNTPRKYKILKWIAGIVGFILLIVGGLALYLSAKWIPLLGEKIREGVHQGSKGLYRIDFKDINLNLFTGTASLDSVRLMPDSAVFNRLKAAKLAPVHLFDIKLAKLQLSHVSILRAYFKKQVEMNAIILDHPSINVIHHQLDKKPDRIKDEKTLYEQISKTLKSIHVKAIRIVDADLDYINGATGKPLNSIRHLDINVHDLLIDSLSQTDTSRIYYTKDIDFLLSGYRSTGKDKMYTMKVDTIKGSVAGKYVTIKGFQMIPLHKDLAFTRKYTYGKDRYDLNFNEISFKGVDFAKFNTDAAFHARSLKIGPAKAGIFVNRELPPPPGLNKLRNFPHVALQRLSIPTIIDTVKLDNIDVAYTEYNPISQKRGTIYFQNLSGTIKNLTNDTLALKKNHHAIANFKAMVMKTSPIDIEIDFDLTAKDAAFHYKGKVGAMDMMVLNPVARDMGLVEIESGKMQSASFDIRANAAGSTGLVHFNYSNLKIKLLKEGEEGEPTKKKGLLSFLANELLIKDQNPSKGEAVRTARVNFQRTPAASFFNLLWKSFFIGMREIVGLGVVPVKSPEQGLKKVNEKLEDRREKREERREERKKKREERRAEKAKADKKAKE